MRIRIVIFAKAPVPGKVKTRLIPAVGAEGAARLAAQMLARTVDQALAADLGPVELCLDPPPSHPDWEGALPDRPVSLSTQGEGELGARLARAAKRVTEEGEAMLLIGTDCPELDADRLRRAAAMLATHDAAIHPTFDGGYALLGLRRCHRSIFERMTWSTAIVASETLARLGALGWTVSVGETLRDIDEPADLAAAGQSP